MRPIDTRKPSRGHRHIFGNPQLSRALMSMHSQLPFSKYTVSLLVHRAGTVEGDNYVSTHPGWLFNCLITMAILTQKECLRFYPNLPTPAPRSEPGNIRTGGGKPDKLKCYPIFVGKPAASTPWSSDDDHTRLTIQQIQIPSDSLEI